jgi:hypothetical protein
MNHNVKLALVVLAGAVVGVAIKGYMDTRNASTPAAS